MLDHRSVESAIQSHKDCPNKDKCNCFNKNPMVICGDGWICSFIKHYEEILNEDDNWIRPKPRIIKKVKLKVTKVGRRSHEEL